MFSGKPLPELQITGECNMSGEKRRYIRVDETELRRLREQESRLRSVQQDLPDRLNAVAQQTRQEMQQRLRYLAERDRKSVV